MVGKLLLTLAVDNDAFKMSMTNATNQLSQNVAQMKNILMAAKLGSYLFGGAAMQANEELKQIQTAFSAMNQGLTKGMVENLQTIVAQLDFVGLGADVASENLYKFVIMGESGALERMGIYLDKNTKAMLQGMSVGDRYAWTMQNLSGKINEVYGALSPTTQKFYEFKKRADDVKKALGTTFLGVLSNIVDGLGGVGNAMKVALGVFATYKIATILGNVGIGISKAIAMGSVFSAPIAIAMGVAALASIGAIIGATALAGSAIDNVPSMDATNSTSSTKTSDSISQNTIQVNVSNDRFGQTQEVITNSNGGGFTSIQTNYKS